MDEVNHPLQDLAFLLRDGFPATVIVLRIS